MIFRYSVICLFILVSYLLSRGCGTDEYCAECMEEGCGICYESYPGEDGWCLEYKNKDPNCLMYMGPSECMLCKSGYFSLAHKVNKDLYYEKNNINIEKSVSEVILDIYGIDRKTIFSVTGKHSYITIQSPTGPKKVISDPEFWNCVPSVFQFAGYEDMDGNVSLVTCNNRTVPKLAATEPCLFEEPCSQNTSHCFPSNFPYFCDKGYYINIVTGFCEKKKSNIHLGTDEGENLISTMCQYGWYIKDGKCYLSSKYSSSTLKRTFSLFFMILLFFL